MNKRKARDFSFSFTKLGNILSRCYRDDTKPLEDITLVFQIPCEDRCLDPQTPPDLVFGGFWKTRVRFQDLFTRSKQEKLGYQKP